MLTPPYHFSIVAAPFRSAPCAQAGPASSSSYPPSASASSSGSRLGSASDDGGIARELLYRGSIPAERNLPFVIRLGLKTLIYLRKKQLKPDDGLVRWAENKGVVLQWIKAESMTEEALGMGRNELVEVLKLVLDPSVYPLYIADLDGISHTTLVVACLRKLMGWHMTSIIDEIARFEPDHEDLPLVPCVAAFLAPSSGPGSVPSGAGATSSSAQQASAPSDAAPMHLPPPPYPSWLWPVLPVPEAGPLEPVKSSGSTPAGREAPSGGPSRSSTSQTAFAANSSTSTALPFAHPLTARRHPSLKLVFPSAPLTQSATPSAGPSSLSRVSTINVPSPSSGRAAGSHAAQPDGAPSDGPTSLVGAASDIIAGLTGLAQTVSNPTPASAAPGCDRGEGAKLQRNVSFSRHNTMASTDSRSPQVITRQTTRTSSGVTPSTDSSAAEEEVDDDEYEEGDEDDAEYDEDEEEEEEEEEGDVPTSQYISALDLAGFG